MCLHLCICRQTQRKERERKGTFMAADQGRRFRLTVKKELERLEKLERQMELAALRQTERLD